MNRKNYFICLSVYYNNLAYFHNKYSSISIKEMISLIKLKTQYKIALKIFNASEDSYQRGKKMWLLLLNSLNFIYKVAQFFHKVENINYLFSTPKKVYRNSSKLSEYCRQYARMNCVMWSIGNLKYSLNRITLQ